MRETAVESHPLRKVREKDGAAGRCTIARSRTKIENAKHVIGAVSWIGDQGADRTDTHFAGSGFLKQKLG